MIKGTDPQQSLRAPAKPRTVAPEQISTAKPRTTAPKQISDTALRADGRKKQRHLFSKVCMRYPPWPRSTAEQGTLSFSSVYLHMGAVAWAFFHRAFW
eukprot:COSAG02_NODE_41170_length_397_cov_0.892617_1_plen_97_part_01